MKIRLTKISELPDALHPGNIEEGIVKEGQFIEEPKIGKCFYAGSFRTSYVKEIIDQNTFKTCNSIYKWEPIEAIEKERNCFSCKNIAVCFVFKAINDSTKKIRVNIDGNSAPGKLFQVYDSMGKCCLEYQK